MATGNVSFTPAGGVSGAVTTVTSVLKTDLVIGEDAQTAVDFETANEIHFDADNAEIAKVTTTGLTMASEKNIYLDVGSLQLDSTPGDEKVSGITAEFTAGDSQNRGDVVYFKAGDSKMWRADADTAAEMPVRAMAAANISADASGVYLLHGFLEDNGTFPTYTVGATIYAPEAEGPPTETRPSSTGDLVQVLGFAITSQLLYFNPSVDVIEHA